MLQKIIKNIDYFFIGLLFLSIFFVGAPYQMTVAGIKVLPFDIVFVIVSGFVIIRALKESTLTENILGYPKILFISFGIFFSLMLFNGEIYGIPAR